MEKEVDEEGGGWRRRWMSKEVKVVLSLDRWYMYR